MEGPYEVVWARGCVEIARTGFAISTRQAAETIGHKGCQWFAAPHGELAESVGIPVTFLTEQPNIPSGFWVDPRSVHEPQEWHQVADVADAVPPPVDEAWTVNIMLGAAHEPKSETRRG